MEPVLIIIAIILLLSIIGPTTKSDSSVPVDGKFDAAGNHLSVFNKGICVTGGLRATTTDVAIKNGLVISKSGGGKTTTVCVATLMKMAKAGWSMFVFDIANELIKIVLGYFTTLKVNNYIISGEENTDGFNPVDLCTSPAASDAVADAIIENGGVVAKGDPYWSTAGKSILSFTLQVIKQGPPKTANMSSVIKFLQVLNAEQYKCDPLVVATNNEKLLSIYKGIVSTPDKVLQSSISTVLASLRVFQQEAVARFCSRTTIPIGEEFRLKQCAIFWCIPVQSLGAYASISVLMLQALFAVLMKCIPPAKARPVGFLIDELHTLRYPQLGTLWSVCRKYKIMCLGLLQHERLLSINNSTGDVYSIITNSFTKVYIQPDYDTCVHLSELMGHVTEVTDKGTRKRLLMEPAQIYASEKAFIIIGKSILTEKMIPYYKHFILRRRAKLPSHEPAQKIPLGDPPTIIL